MALGGRNGGSEHGGQAEWGAEARGDSVSASLKMGKLKHVSSPWGRNERGRGNKYG